MLVRQRYKVRARKDQRCWRGYAYRKGKERHAVVNLGIINEVRRKKHRGEAWLIGDIIGTVEHEIAHALVLTSDWAPGVREERFILRFERAGRWARSAG